MLVRVGRRTTAWAPSDVDTILKNEFMTAGELELQVSVYLIEGADLERTVAEHGASYELGLRGFANVDLTTDRPIVKTPGDTLFGFTQAAHREIHFGDADELRSFLVERILPEVEQRKHVVPRASLKAYVKKRREAHDEEWLAYFREHDDWP